MRSLRQIFPAWPKAAEFELSDVALLDAAEVDCFAIPVRITAGLPYAGGMAVIRSALVLLVLVLAVTGCAGPDSAPSVLVPSLSTPSSTPSPIPTVDVTVSAIVIGATGLAAENAAGGVLDSVRYDEGAQVLVEFLTGLFGVGPTVNESGTGMCMQEPTIYVWGDLNDGVSVREIVEPEVAYRGTFVVTQRAEMYGLAIEASAGFAVGDNVQPLIDQLPAEQAALLHSVAEGGSESFSFVFDLGEPVDVAGQERAYGGVVVGDSGVAAMIGGPRVSGSLYC